MNRPGIRRQRSEETCASLDSGLSTLSSQLVIAVLAAMCAAALAVTATEQLILLLAAAGVATAAVLIWRDVDQATWLVLFVIYSNLAVVAVRHHGVPLFAANAVVGLLLLPMFYYGVVRREGFVLGSAFPWLTTFAGVQLLGVLVSQRPEVAWIEFQTFLQEGVLLYVLIVNCVRTERTLRGATWALLLAGCLMGGVPLFQQLTGSFDHEFGGLSQLGGEPGFLTGEITAAGEVRQPRLSGPIGEKNRYAQIMLMLAPLAMFTFHRERHRGLKTLAAAALVCIAAGTLLAFSRSAIVAAVLVMLFAAWVGYLDRRKVAVVLVLGVAALLATPQYRARLASLVNIREMMLQGRHSSADGALKGRATEMGAAALVYLDHPVVGVGPGMFKFYAREYGERIGLRSLEPQRQAHCLLLDVAAQHGTLGLAALLGVFAATGWGLYRASVSPGVGAGLRSDAAAWLLVLAVYFASGLFLHFAFIRYFWVAVALADCAVRIARRHSV